jgi:hypothetical protein
VDHSELSNVYGDEADDVIETPAQQETETPAVDTPETTDVKTAEAAVETKAKVQEPPSGSDETRVPLAALTGERERRQEAQREAEELRAKLAALETKKPAPSVFEDEKGFVESLKTDFDSKLINDRLNLSEALAVREFGAEKVKAASAWFKEAATKNPSLADRFRSAPLQFHAVVDMHAEHIELEKMKDLPAYKAQIRAEVEAEVKAKLEADLKEKQKLRDSIPTSLAGDASKGGLKGAAWAGPTPDEEIYKD